MEVGVDIAKPQGVDTPEEIKRAITEIPGPFMATLSQAAGKARLYLRDLEQLGAAAVSLPSVTLFAAARAVSEVLAKIATSRSVAGLDGVLMPLDDYYNLVRLPDEQQREEAYQDAARSLVETRDRAGANQ